MNPRSKFPEAFDESADDTTAERRLMMAVIIAAINDAVGCSPSNDPPGERERARAVALRWFENNSRDFQIVCLHAGFEPSKVRAAALGYIYAQGSNPRALTPQSVDTSRSSLAGPMKFRAREFAEIKVAA